MKSISTLSIYTLLLICLSCDNKSKTENDSVSNIAPSEVGPTNSTTSTQTVASQPTQDPVVPTTTGNNTTSITGKSKGLNPAHGEPGHRCDIPVGSPLNSKPAQQPAQNTQVVQTQPVQNTQVIQSPVITQPNTTVVQTTGNTTTQPGKNPAHGQPGHRCDIEVGAPLNSKPAQTTTTQNNTITLPANPQVTPAKPTISTQKDQ